MRPTQDTEVCTHCGDRGCPRRSTVSSQPAPIEWIVDCMQRQLNKQARELWELRRDVARLSEASPRRDRTVGPSVFPSRRRGDNG